jgi:arylsulfatase A-like enzyme
MKPSVLLGAFALLAGFHTASVFAAPDAPPNVLFIVVDDLKPLLGCYGSDVPTPNIDRIAAAGTSFLNAQCQQAVCGPSRASALTGRRPDYTRIWDLQTLIRDRRPDIVTLPQFFRQHGYETVGVGKVFDPRSVDKSLDAASWSTPYVDLVTLHYNSTTGEAIGGYQSSEVHAAHEKIAINGKKPAWSVLKKKLFAQNLWRATECADVPDDAYDDGVIANYAVEKLPALAASAKPFFLAVGFKKPHLPFAAPKKYWDLFDRARLPLAVGREQAVGSPAYAYHSSPELRAFSDIPSVGPLSDEKSLELIHGYYASVSYIDAQVGRVLDALKKSGAADRTIVILWGDHGWHLGDHGLWTKHTNFEQATRVPLIIAAPGQNARGTSTAHPVEFVDIFPTLCDLTGLPPPVLDGISLVPVLKDPAAPTKEFAVSQFPRGPRMGYALRTERHRLVAWYKAGEHGFADGTQPPDTVELYDYQTDPLETRSLTKDTGHKALADQLLAKLQNFLVHQRTH